jgi:predicted MPP superfamily phosphohydrolase
MISRRGFFKLVAGLLIAGFGTSSYAVAVEPMARPRVTRYAVRPANWPSELKLKIVALADFHACEPWMPASRIAEICDQANALGGDIIVLLGDYLSGMIFSTPIEAASWAKAMARLSAPLGVHSILGNHDWEDDPVANATGQGPTSAHKAFASIGVPVYDNRTVRMEKDGQPFWLAGLADQLEPAYPGKDGEVLHGLDDLPGTLAQISDDAPIILLAHEPDIFTDVPKRVSLTLSGHTHGGQLRVLGFSPFVPSRYGNRFAYGHVVEEDRHLIVSGGLGCTVLPFRLGSQPEIVVVDVG